MNDPMTLAELAEISGIPARTIRFYIARGLVEGPVKAGRGAPYASGHLERLERIKRLQGEGRTLAEIGLELAGDRQEATMEVAASEWRHYAIAEDVVVEVRAGLSPWRARQVRAAIEEFARRLPGAEDNGRRS